MKRLTAAAMAGAMVLAMAGCGSKETARTLNGKTGDTLSTMFFDYTVTTARLEDEMQGMTGHDGYKLLVADVTITNNTESAIEMSDADFFISWGDGDTDYDYPVTLYSTTQLSDRQMPAKYELEAGGSKSGELIFAVPPEATSFGLKTQDYYTDGKSSEPVAGDIYTVTIELTGEAEETTSEESGS